jgi:hypothetical protein
MNHTHYEVLNEVIVDEVQCEILLAAFFGYETQALTLMERFSEEGAEQNIWTQEVVTRRL